MILKFGDDFNPKDEGEIFNIRLSDSRLRSQGKK
tara:strand:+ start:5805 stop:5906 length:102 start_codon:yes stop_codon:yes gene_type:complete